MKTKRKKKNIPNNPKRKAKKKKSKKKNKTIYIVCMTLTSYMIHNHYRERVFVDLFFGFCSRVRIYLAI